MRLLRLFLGFLVLGAFVAGIAYFMAGRAAGPAITINSPALVGQSGMLDVTIETPGAVLSGLSIAVAQNGQTYSLVTGDSKIASRETSDRLRVRQPFGKQAVPQLKTGTATVTVVATRPVLRGLRQASARSSRDIQVRLEPPRIGVISTHHYINVGGSEFIVYRVTPPDVTSGVRVGDVTYPGFDASGAGIKTEPGVKVAFFALLFNQTPGTPMELFARDAAGNEGRAQFEQKVFDKKFRSSTIPLDNAFLDRVVPAIASGSPELSPLPEDRLQAFLKINNELRQRNNRTIAELAAKTSPEILWHGAFQTLGGSQVESAFADFRTYSFGGKNVDKQVHLGFDLAKTANAPVTAANDGKVVWAKDLGIYGNCVILDHGMGVQSLYGHLSSFDVHEGQDVKKGDSLGRSGKTGLAGGDHLHFSMLVNGQFVNATEWWDAHWIEDRITRKLREAAAGPGGQ